MNEPSSDRMRPFRKITDLIQRYNPWHKNSYDDAQDQLDAIEEILEDSDVAIDTNQKELLSNILELNECCIYDIMVPRADIVAVEGTIDLENLLKIFQESNHSRLPVYQENLDEVVGFVHIKDVLPFWNRQESFNIKPIMRPIVFVAPSMRVLDLLLQMRQSQVHMALVIDEYGGIDGLVTIEDVLEEVIGEIQDEHANDQKSRIDYRSDGTFVVDGRIELETLEEAVGPFATAEERDENDTLGGLVFSLLGRVPSRGEIVKHPANIEFEILDVDPRRVKKVRIRPSKDFSTVG